VETGETPVRGPGAGAGAGAGSGGCDALVGALWRLRFPALRRKALSPGACVTALRAGGRGVVRGTRRAARGGVRCAGAVRCARRAACGASPASARHLHGLHKVSARVARGRPTAFQAPPEASKRHRAQELEGAGVGQAPHLPHHELPRVLAQPRRRCPMEGHAARRPGPLEVLLHVGPGNDLLVDELLDRVPVPTREPSRNEIMPQCRRWHAELARCTGCGPCGSQRGKASERRGSRAARTSSCPRRCRRAGRPLLQPDA
jgi:hypothetical protein